MIMLVKMRSLLYRTKIIYLINQGFRKDEDTGTMIGIL